MVKAAGLFLITVAALACADEQLVALPEESIEESPPAELIEEPPPEVAPPPAEDSGTACLDDSECGSATECESGVCVGVGIMQVTLSFDANTDADLHVITPTGEELYFANPSAAGGVLDVDACVSDCGVGTHVENIFFNGAMAPGVYTAFAINFDGRDGGPFRIDVSGAASVFLEGTMLAVGGEPTVELQFAIEP